MDDDDIPLSKFRCKLGLLYFIRSGVSGPIKIGRTANISARFKMLQTGSPVPLRILATFKNEGWQEYIWHRAFAKDRLSGEWFEPTKELLDAVDRFREEWDWPRAFPCETTELWLDLIDIVGDLIDCDRIHNGDQLKIAFKRAEVDSNEFAAIGLYDERFPVLMQKWIDSTKEAHHG